MVSGLVIGVVSSIFLCAVILLVLVGNTLVVLAVATTRKLRTVTNVFIVNLACADLLLGVLILPFSAVLEIKDVWIFGQIWCQAWLAVDVWLCTASILNLCCISFDRYVAITWPIRYPGLMSSRRAKTLVAGVWLFSFIIGCPPLIGWNDYRVKNVDSNWTTPQPVVTTIGYIVTNSSHLICDSDVFVSDSLQQNSSCTAHTGVVSAKICELTSSRGYRIYAALGSFFIPMLVMVFFYLQIYRAAVRTISAYAKGELKTKYSVREKENGMKTSSVTLRVHRGGRGYNANNSSWGNAQGNVHCISSGNTTCKQGTANKGRAERPFEDVGRLPMRRTRSSDASLETLLDLNPDTEIADPATAHGTVQRRCKSFCWRSENKCVECQKQRSFRDRNQNGGDSSSKVFGIRCMSMDSEESSSGDAKPEAKRSYHQRTSSETSTPLTTSASCHAFDTGIVYIRGTSESDKPRRPRFSAQKSANAMKLHMQKFNREKKAAKTLAIIVGAFILCWMPFFTTYLVDAFCDNCISSAVFSVVFWLGYCNSAMNPFVYALFSQDFRFAFRKLLTCKCTKSYRNRHCLPHINDVPTIQLHCAPQDDARSCSDIEGQWR
ncbi:unnamed protein product [Candidula unifasciata]|uniref:G-protein coupled receptors family 1 profile domain-containing protein n=1 Tax=Candidula unifasciata TaxID=100452 RepID=A0A8S3YR06_9EUPU|nr:unnamed protein product [Candidula unifasciata]